MGKKKKTKDAKGVKEVRIDPYRVWLAGLGAAARAEDGESELFEELVRQGRDTLSARGKKVKKRVREIGEEFRDWFHSTKDDVGTWVGRQATEAAQRMGLPSAEAVEELTRRVEELTSRLGKVQPPPRARPKPGRRPSKAARGKPEAAKAEIHVLFRDGSWLVVEGDTGPPLSQHPTKAPAVQAARAVAAKRKAGVLVVHLKDGKVQSRTEIS